ncbi:MAG: PKD domain-containing protein, partial [Bacteroidota bacterium]|nr:PKD domain-containing protein [Bacteroidota bacterium]
GAVSYSWSPTTGLNTSTGAVVIATHLVTTTYYVTGTDANNCTDTDSITVTVIALPTIMLTGDTIICLGDSTTLTASGGVTYLWTPGNFTDSIIKVSPTSDITYTVVVTNSSGCSDSSSIKIIVKPLPQALFNLNPVCKNASTIFNDASLGGAVSWKWQYGDGTVSALQNSIYTYATCGTFNAKLVVTTDDGCKDSTTKTARVYCLPVADFSFADECLNQTINFTDLSAVAGDTVSVWSWDFGDTSPLSIVQNPGHAYNASGPFAVSLIATSNNGCKDTVVKNVNVYPLPIITLTGDTLICLGDSTTLTAQGGATYLWSPGNFTDSIIKVSPATTSVYSVIVTSSDVCIDSSSINMIVNPLPQALFNLTPVCKNAAMIFNDASAGNILNWNWNYGDGTLSTL